jgi:disulfide bond formation protein DsbB
MSKGMRLMIMMLILVGVIVGMMQCAKKTMTHKHPAGSPSGLAPSVPIHSAHSG